MAQHQTLFVPRQSDRALVMCLQKLASRYDIQYSVINTLGHGVLPNLVNLLELSDELNALLDHESALIEIFTLKIGGLLLSFRRGGHEEPPSPHCDAIRLTIEKDASITLPERLDIVSTLIKDLRAFDPARTVQGLSKEQNQLEALHQSMLERLETTATRLIETQAEHGENLQTKYQENEVRRSTELEAHKQLLTDDHTEKLEALKKREDEFQARVSEIDDRDNTHVRRELRRDLIKEIQKRSEQFKLTKGTNKLRWSVHGACLVGLVALGAGSVVFAMQLTAFVNAETFETLPFVVVALKQLGMTLGAVAIGFFYIRWLNRWFDQHAKAEFELKQFQLDIDRASWLVETALEWNASEGGAIPDTLLDSLTKNLFSQGEHVSNEQVAHPADMLASALLGTASKAQIKIGDSTLEFDGKKLKKQMGNVSKDPI